MVIWLIGVSGSGKTAVGRALCDAIVDGGSPCVFIDGDIIREICGNDLGHTLADRKLNAERICRLCRHLDSQRVNVVCGVLSLFKETRDWNREHLSAYFQVYLDSPLEEVLKRDEKGIYSKAQRGELSNVVGVDIPFPPPLDSDLTLPNDFTKNPRQLAAEIYSQIRDRLYGA